MTEGRSKVTNSTNGNSNGHGVSFDLNSLTAIGLQKTYGTRRVVDDVSVSLAPGEVVGLLGANGAGKTTTFYMIVGVERSERGAIMLNGRDVSSLPMY